MDICAHHPTPTRSRDRTTEHAAASVHAAAASVRATGFLEMYVIGKQSARRDFGEWDG